MLISEFDELMEAKPFLPFRMVTADGRSMLVKSPEFAWRPPTKTDLRVVCVATQERIHMIDLHWVTKFIVGHGKANGTKRRRSR